MINKQLNLELKVIKSLVHWFMNYEQEQLNKSMSNIINKYLNWEK